MSLPAAFTVNNPASLAVLCDHCKTRAGESPVVLAGWDNYSAHVPLDLRERRAKRIRSDATMLAMEHTAATGHQTRIEISQRIDVHPKERRT